MDPQAFVDRLHRERAVAILRCGEPSQAAPAMEAALRGGFRTVEVTLTTPGALPLIAELAARPGVVVGAGTVLTSEQANEAVAAGAGFLVSPVVDPRVIRRAGELGVACLPGAHTPTELLAAHHAGAPLLKLFPAPAGGPAWLRAVLAPLPFLRIVPTNGVDPDNAPQWLAAGAWAVGFGGGSLFAAEDLGERNWERIEERARRILTALGRQPEAVPAPAPALG